LAHAGSIGAKLDASELEEIQTGINSKLLGVQEDEAPSSLCHRKILKSTRSEQSKKAFL
jgi:hypothetical protein